MLQTKIAAIQLFSSPQLKRAAHWASDPMWNMVTTLPPLLEHDDVTVKMTFGYKIKYLYHFDIILL